jgi:hypothetical protein
MSLCTTLSFVSVRKYLLQFGLQPAIHSAFDEISFFVENLNELLVTDFFLNGVCNKFLVEDSFRLFVEFFQIFEAFIVFLHVDKLFRTDLKSFKQLNSTANK